MQTPPVTRRGFDFAAVVGCEARQAAAPNNGRALRADAMTSVDGSVPVVPL